MKNYVFIPKHIEQLNVYQPGPTSDQLKDMLGVNRIISLWNNENPIGISPKAEQAIKNAIQNTHYYPDPAASALCEKIGKHLTLDASNIAVGNGGESLMMLMLTAFCEPEDEILSSEGSFVIMYLWADIRNLKLLKVPMTSDYGFDLDAIFNSITSKTKVIYLANANNPTGSGISTEKLKNFLEKVPKHILVLVDEAYFEFSKHIDPAFPDSTQWRFENVLTLRSFSKCYGLAGLRLGYMVGPKRLIDAVKKVKLTFEPSHLAQVAGIAALDEHDYLKKVLENNKSGLQQYYKAMEELEVRYMPSYANFVLLDLKTPTDAEAVFESLYKRGILVRKLKGNGLSHCLRISISTPENNHLAIQALKEILPACYS